MSRKGHTNNPDGAPVTWETPQDLLADFEKFLEHQKPHLELIWVNKRQLRDGVESKHPTKDDYEWVPVEEERLTRQGLITIVQFAAWKRIHRTTITTGYSEGEFKTVYQLILSICEAFSENRLYDAERNAANIIFAMKNSYGWVDKTETELSGSISQPLSPEAKAILNKANRVDENGAD